MKLKDLLPTLSKNTYLKIHAVNGSSHIYCYKNDMKALEKVNHALTLNSERLVRKAEKKINSIKRNAEQEYINSGFSNCSFIDKKVNNRCKTLKRLIKERQWNINNDLLDREVIDYYEGILDREKPTIIINITGYEVGGYWSIDEFRRDLKKYGLC